MGFTDLKELIILARGTRNQSEFALHCKINASILTRVMKEERMPTPATLKKIAERAYNGVTYEQLLQAAGYLDTGIGAQTPDPALVAEYRKLRDDFESYKKLNMESYGGLSAADKEFVEKQFNELVDRLRKK